jgi:hypothetical protein
MSLQTIEYETANNATELTGLCELSGAQYVSVIFLQKRELKKNIAL